MISHYQLFLCNVFI